MRPKSNSWYELIAGNGGCEPFVCWDEATIRRWCELDDEDMGLLALLENLQRLDLFGRKQGYARLLSEFDLTQEELAQR